MNNSDKLVPIKAGYDLWSTSYDVYPNSTVAIDERYFPAQWSDLRDRAVIEIGCGTGRHTRRLLQQGNRVTGIDVSAGMVAVAREKLAAHPGLRLIEGDFLRLDRTALGRFDALVAALVLEHVHDLPAFFRGATEVLVHGGEVFISEIHPLRAANGTLAHFRSEDGQEHHLDSLPHPTEAIEAAATNAGLVLASVRDTQGDEALAQLNPQWTKHLGKSLTRMWHWLRI